LAASDARSALALRWLYHAAALAAGGRRRENQSTTASLRTYAAQNRTRAACSRAWPRAGWRLRSGGNAAFSEAKREGASPICVVCLAALGAARRVACAAVNSASASHLRSSASQRKTLSLATRAALARCKRGRVSRVNAARSRHARMLGNAQEREEEDNRLSPWLKYKYRQLLK